MLLHGNSEEQLPPHHVRVMGIGRARRIGLRGEEPPYEGRPDGLGVDGSLGSVSDESRHGSMLALVNQVIDWIVESD